MYSMPTGKRTNTFLILTLVILVLSLCYFLWTKSTRSNSLSVNYGNDGLMITPKYDLTPTQQSSGTTTKYINYRQGVLEDNVGKRRILFFFANWCPTCKPADADIKAKENFIPEEGIFVIEVSGILKPVF